MLRKRLISLFLMIVMVLGLCNAGNTLVVFAETQEEKFDISVFKELKEGKTYKKVYYYPYSDGSGKVFDKPLVMKYSINKVKIKDNGDGYSVISFELKFKGNILKFDKELIDELQENGFDRLVWDWNCAIIDTTTGKMAMSCGYDWKEHDYRWVSAIEYGDVVRFIKSDVVTVSALFENSVNLKNTGIIVDVFPVLPESEIQRDRSACNAFENGEIPFDETPYYLEDIIRMMRLS